MTTAIPAQPMTAAAFLFPGSESIGPVGVVSSDQASIKAMADALQQQGALGSISAAVKTLSRAGLGAVSNQIATPAHGLLNLDLDLGGLVVDGWCQFADLTAAAKHTAAVPGSEVVVDLATHSITWTHNPQIDVLVNDARVATVHFELSIRFTVKGLAATVRRGNLVRLSSGGCEVTGTLAAEGRQLAQREAQFQLPLLVRLGDGIPVLGSGREPAGGQDDPPHVAPLRHVS
jgi:hypothetical protein